jgi:hypothetical protein
MIFKLVAKFMHLLIRKIFHISPYFCLFPELPYCSVESAEEIHQIFVDVHLNLDKDFELDDDLPNYYID